MAEENTKNRTLYVQYNRMNYYYFVEQEIYEDFRLSVLFQLLHSGISLSLVCKFEGDQESYPVNITNHILIILCINHTFIITSL